MENQTPQQKNKRELMVVDQKPKEIKKDDKPEYAYGIKIKGYGMFQVRNSANAWWLDRQKLDAVINAFCYDATYEEVAVSADIHVNTLKYFLKKHPEFMSVIEACRQIPTLRARQTVVSQIATDGNLAFKYLERKKADEFGTKEKAPLVIIPVDMRSVASAYRPGAIEAAGAQAAPPTSTQEGQGEAGVQFPVR